jgi:hypothetical protein
MLLTRSGRQEVSLVDLSESGAGLLVPLPAGISGGMLKWMDYEVYGTVVRQAGQNIGLLFEEPIATAWVLDTRAWLPSIADERTKLRRFAQDWVGSIEAAEPARISHMTGPRFGSSSAARETRAAWLLAGAPFIVGAIVLGAIIGIGSTYF